MTEKERELALYCLKASSDYHSEVCEECINYPNCDHTIQDDVTETIIKALEQEPCDCISREFIEIVVEYPPAELCTYPEYKGKPYFSIKYRENGKEYVGFGTYKIEFLSQWIKEYFMSDNQPKPKTGHWVEEKINGGRKVFCSECGCPPPFEYVSNGDVYSASGFGVINKTKFCPNCGARMVESQESEDKE